ncbi:hypothetical protein ABEB36_013978 [Hypothenemus hampei]|uniref:Uncharacterized protein n=1 Tax=Hypothenemus hampei TaxID=57062 RepID=A0ABD1E2Y5_HYPHA
MRGAPVFLASSLYSDWTLHIITIELHFRTSGRQMLPEQNKKKTDISSFALAPQIYSHKSFISYRQMLRKRR